MKHTFDPKTIYLIPVKIKLHLNKLDILTTMRSIVELVNELPTFKYTEERRWITS